jgi:hypothetical protein
MQNMKQLTWTTSLIVQSRSIPRSRFRTGCLMELVSWMLFPRAFKEHS